MSQELSNKKDASTWDIMDLLRLDDAMAEALGMIDLQPDASQLMVPVHHKQDSIFVLIDDPLSDEALIEPPAEVPATNVLSTLVIVPHSDPFVFVEDYDNPDLVECGFCKKRYSWDQKGEEKIDASAGGDLAFSKLDDEARDAIL
ncbi:hypothetical protein Tco_0778403 [Tanacetum coccineum]